MIRGLRNAAPLTRALVGTCGACFLLALALVGALVCVSALPAHADEIVVRDLNTGEESAVTAKVISSETWSEVKYRERDRGAEKIIPALTVTGIRRSDKSANAESLRMAIAELGRGNYREAADALQAINGGGLKPDLETGINKFVSFSENDPKGKNKRPSWISEYSHFYYAKALYMQGVKTKDRDILNQAHWAVDDVPVDGAEGTSGGFVGRFANGNSRFFPEALAIKANVLVHLARYDDAAKAFSELHNAAISVPLLPKWAYEGKIGAGTIAEAKGDLTGAVEAYNSAGSTLWVLLGQEQRKWMQREIGRYISRTRMRTAAVMLKSAEERKAASAFRELRTWLQGGLPDTLRQQGKSRGLSPDAVNALVGGARDPKVQAVGLNGLGLAFLNEPKPKYEEALLAFKAVTVRYFQEPEQHARALYYLRKAAQGAEKAADGEAKAMYSAMATEAGRTLKEQHPDSEWARK